ncbi:MAG: NYN domain-containing protein [Fimbriimonadaceae bacterium]|nr:NYN domain-containing protein [Fimbriimonadaceae bacterium]QYK59274.1 MAG: NYN domain-containing protein [Fimbriimonadaceae bacterium]
MTVSPKPGFASVFIDFENIYYFFREALPEGVNARDMVLRLVRELKKHMLEERQENCIILHAYADFERIEDDAMGDFYLVGVETHNVLGTQHKNAADMRLCIDALETMYTRSEIGTFVFVAGDRDYIPVVQHLKKHARNVLIVAFPGQISGDLLNIVGEESFLDGRTLLPDEIAGRISIVRKKTPSPALEPVATNGSHAAKPAVSAVSFATPKRLSSAHEREALGILLHDFGKHHEVYVMPYLYRLGNEMSDLDQYERKDLVNSLTSAGAIKVEKREGVDRHTGERNTYSVIIINWDHPDVRVLSPG